MKERSLSPANSIRSNASSASGNSRASIDDIAKKVRRRSLTPDDDDLKKGHRILFSPSPPPITPSFETNFQPNLKTNLGDKRSAHNVWSSNVFEIKELNYHGKYNYHTK